MSWFNENLDCGFADEDLLEYEPERKSIDCLQCGGTNENCPLCKGEKLQMPYGTKGKQ